MVSHHGSDGHRHRPRPMARRTIGDTGAMGFNPQRAQKRRPTDLLFVVAALVICCAAVTWALLA